MGWLKGKPPFRGSRELFRNLARGLDEITEIRIRTQMEEFSAGIPTLHGGKAAPIHRFLERARAVRIDLSSLARAFQRP